MRKRPRKDSDEYFSDEEVNEAIIECIEPEERFFLEKIKEGADLINKNLSSEEEAMLCLPAERVAGLMSASKAQELDSMCVEALQVIYAVEVKNNGKESGLIWRENNVTLYNNSDLCIAGVVQNWYLSIGRGQEKQLLGFSLKNSILKIFSR